MRPRSPQFRYTLVAGLLLAVGVGAVATMLTVLRALSPAGLPYPDAGRLVIARVGGPSWSPAMFEVAGASSTVFEAIAGFQERAAALGSGPGPDAGGPAEIARIESVSAAYFQMLGVAPAAGRVFGPAEDARNGSAAVALISDALWNRKFNRRADVLGQRLDVDGRSLEVIGVMPANFAGLIGRTDVWTPLGSARWLSGDAGPERPTSRWFEVLARIRPGVSVAAAGARFAEEARAAILALPSGDRIVGPRTAFTLVPLAEARVPRVVPQAVRVLTIAVSVLLTLVIVNVASLTLLRTGARARELAIRLALGAGLRQIAAMALRESAAVSALAVGGALLLRPIFLSALEAVRPAPASFGIVTSRVLLPESFGLDAGIGASVVLLALAATMPLAAAVVIKARRLSVERALRQGGATGAGRIGRPAGWTRTAFVTVQATLACGLVGCGFLLARSASELLERDRGYALDGVVTARLNLPNRYDGAHAAVLFEQLAVRLAGRPGVMSASVSNCAPGGGRCRQTNVTAVDGRPVVQTAQPTVGIHYATPGHFATIGATIARGRGIDERDREGAPLVAVVSEPLASLLWPGGDPIGRTLEVFTANGSLNGARTVVGVVKPLAYNLEADPGLDVFLPASQAGWASGVVFVKSTAGVAAVSRAIADAVASVDRSIAVSDAGSLRKPVARSLSVEAFMQRTLLVFGIIGLVLAAAGAYAVTAQAVTDTHRELGIRLALGATPGQIGQLVGRRGLVMALVAAIAGAFGVVWAGSVLRAFLHGFTPTDPVALAAGPLVVVLSLAMAVVVPAIRASRMDPASTLRQS